MRRGLKGTDMRCFFPEAAVADRSPMRRGLKGERLGLPAWRERSCRPLPDEEGTERLRICSYR